MGMYGGQQTMAPQMQQPFQYASRAGRMRNAARQQNALQGWGGMGGGMNALQGFARY